MRRMTAYMRIKNEIMLHISRKTDWKIGDIIDVGKNENPFWNKCRTFSPEVEVNGQKMPLFEMFTRYESFDVTENNINFLYSHLKGISTEVAFYIREQVFEEVRKNKFNSLPSRHKCIWLTNNENLAYWKTMSENRRALLTLEVNGDIFCGDGNWLTIDTLSSVEYEQRAFHYWNGEFSNAPRKEYLFYGQAIVKKSEII